MPSTDDFTITELPASSEWRRERSKESSILKIVRFCGCEVSLRTAGFPNEIDWHFCATHEEKPPFGMAQRA